MKTNKNIIYILSITFILIITFFISYALYTFSDTGEENKIKTGTITLNYIEGNEALAITNISSITDDEAKISDNFFEFMISSSATGKVNVGYYIYITTDTTNTAGFDSSIKYYLTSVTNNIETPITLDYISNTIPFNIDTLTKDTSSLNRILHTNYFIFNNDSTTQSMTYRYRMWVDSSSFDDLYNISSNDGTHQITSNSSTFKIKINVLGTDGIPNNIS